METLRAIWAIIAAIWNTGNRWARWAIAIIVLWPFLLVVIALAGIPLLTSLLALLPIVSVLLLLLAFLDPLLVAALGTFHKGRIVLRWIATIIGMELVTGVYFSMVPVWNDPGLVPLLILVIIAILFLSLGIQGKLTKKTVAILAIIVVILTAIFVFGGRDSGGERLKNLYQKIGSSPQRATAAAQQQWQLCWEKKPEYEGKTGTRYKCLPAKIESRNESHIIVSYSGGSGRGIQEGTSTDGKNYDGEWRDSTGWGKWHLKFVSSDTAFGWSDDEGKGEKQPNVLEKIKS